VKLRALELVDPARRNTGASAAAGVSRPDGIATRCVRALLSAAGAEHDRAADHEGHDRQSCPDPSAPYVHVYRFPDTQANAFCSTNQWCRD
jgi:hypothetical protein